MQTEYEKLLAKLDELTQQCKQVQQQINAIDYQKRYDSKLKYVGKYFERRDGNPNWIQCIYIYGVSQDCRALGINVDYWTDSKIYFSLGYCDHFKLNSEEEDNDWVEITKQQYMQHYDEVQKCIKNALQLPQ